MTRFLIKKSLEQAHEKLQTVLTEQKLQFKQVNVSYSIFASYLTLRENLYPQL